MYENQTQRENLRSTQEKKKTKTKQREIAFQRSKVN